MKLVKISRCFPELPVKQQSSALVLSFDDDVLDAVLKIKEAEIAGENDTDTIITRLNRLFIKTLQQKIIKLSNHS